MKWNRLCLFGDIRDDEMVMNDAGRMVQKSWMDLSKRFTGIKFNDQIIMPNHFHGIIVGAPLVGALVKKTDDVCANS